MVNCTSLSFNLENNIADQVDQHQHRFWTMTRKENHENPLGLMLQFSRKKNKILDLINKVFLPRVLQHYNRELNKQRGSTTEQINRRNLVWPPTRLKSAPSHLRLDGTMPSRNCAANVEYASAFKKKLLIINLISVLKGSLIL